jgi:GGDEF domain-containing protein
MKELRNSLLLLLAYVIGFLGIAQIQYLETNYINFEEVFFVMFALAATIGVLLPGFFRPSLYLSLVVWAIVYALVWFLYWRVLEEPLTTLVLGLQFILLELAAGLSHFVGLHVDEVEFLLNELSTHAYPNRMLELTEARERIDTEMMRSRRLNHPLAILALQVKNTSERDIWSEMKSLQQELLKRFSVAKTAQMISKLARQTDLIILESNDRFLVVCPETTLSDSAILAERICKHTKDKLDSEMVWGSASFPQESFSFDELLDLALQRMKDVADTNHQ